MNTAFLVFFAGILFCAIGSAFIVIGKKQADKNMQKNEDNEKR